MWIVKNNKTWHEFSANHNRSERYFLESKRFIMQCHSATVPFVGFCCSLLPVRWGFLLISGYKIKTVMCYSSEYYTHWWLWLLKFRTTSSQTNMPQCHPRGPLCLVWRALTLGLWPLPEATPLSALLLLEDHTLFILLDSFLFFCFPAPLFQCRMELSVDLKHSLMRGPQQVQLLTFDLRETGLHLCMWKMS